MEAVTLNDLSKTFPGGKKAVDRLSFSLDQGEVFGFLGPNGAGKTTTVKLLNGMLTPTEGRCLVMGKDPASEPEQVHAAAGVVTEHAQMYDGMTGIQNLIFYASVYGVERNEAEKRAGELLRRLELDEAKDQKLSAYSTGMRQRLSLARALIHRPKVLFLDEPTSGLDPESAQNVNGLIRELAEAEGTTVFLCTHQLRYAQEICTRYGLIDRGRMLATGTLEQLRAGVTSPTSLQVCVANMPGGLPFSKISEQNYEAAIRSEEEIPGLVRKIVEGGGEIYAVKSQKPTLEDIYFALTTERKEEPR